MALHTSHFIPSSPFYTSYSFSNRLDDLRQNPFVSKAASKAYHNISHFTDDIISRLDRIDTLGGEDTNGELVGHTGCVNALAWSQSGHCLATGSDDRRIILWKLGSSDEHPTSYTPSPFPDVRGYPKLNMAQADVIETGHRANIFNVKWAPNCSDQRLFTCAGDNQIRVFDLNRASSSASIDMRMKSGKEYRLWEQDRGCCTRVLRCHSGRAKKISTENSPDVFLSAAEDGEVRQTDLRVPHTCSRSQSYGEGCPRPLMQFKMELYSISLSIQQPWLFAIAGTSDKVYLQDRRMIPRLLKLEWGSYLGEETAALTHCVRRFCREPKDDKGEGGAASRIYGRAHVTAVKISEANGRDLLASYSGDGVYRFDIKAEPGSAKKKESLILHSSKRRKTSSGSATPQPDESTINGLAAPIAGSVSPEMERRKRIFTALFHSEFTAETHEQLTEDLAALLEEPAVTFSEADVKEHVLEEGTIAFCRLLTYVKYRTAGQTEWQEMDLDDHILQLSGTIRKKARRDLIPIIREMQHANIVQDYKEEVFLRSCVWEQAEDYIKSQWKIDGYCGDWVTDEEEEEDGDTSMEDADSPKALHSELDAPEVVATRRRVYATLFRPGSDFTAETYAQLEQDLDQLTEAIPDAEHWTEEIEDRCMEEEGTIALCNLLIYIKRMRAERNEMVPLQLHDHKILLLGTLTRFAHGELMPLIEELEELNREGLYSSEGRLRHLLWSKSQRYIKSQWGIDGYTTDEYILGELDREDGIPPDMDVLHGLDRADAPDSGEEDGYTDDEDEDDGDDDDEGGSPPHFEESDDDEPEVDRHGISGGDAPFVYPNGCFLGHANNETVKDCGFIGSNDEYIWSGSDDGHFFIWTNDVERRLMGIWKGDGSVVNALTQHPVLPIIALSGIDDSVKIFGPVSHGSQRITDAMSRKDEIIRRNTTHERVGFNSNMIRRIVARQMGLAQGTGEGAGEGEEEECTVM